MSISEPAKQAMRKKQAAGAWFGRVPYGWRAGRHGRRLDRTAWQIDRQAMEIVKKIRAMRAAGASYRGIARKLNGMGRPSPTGRKWGLSSIHYIATNPIYREIKG